MTSLGRRRFALGCCGCLALGALPARAPAAGGWNPPGRFTRPEEASDEGGLWAMMDREEDRLRRSAFVMRDRALNDYVRAIACRLAGGHCPDVRVYLLRTPHFNASMAPNGMLQVWSGLLLRAANEAQLAAVLGHEIGHYYARHSLQQLRDVKKRAAWAEFAGLLLSRARNPDIGNLAQLGIVASMFAYTRDQEREADSIGLELLARAGYAPGEASTVWTQLLEEIKGDKISKEEYAGESILFSTHPPMEERQETLAKAAKELARPEASRLGGEEYRNALSAHRTQFLEDEVRRRRYGESLVLLERLQKNSGGDGEIEFFRGEVYRMRNGKGDLELALKTYRQAEGMAGAPAELYRSEGLVLRQLKQDEGSRAAFRRYLELKPAAEDADLVRTYL